MHFSLTLRHRHLAFEAILVLVLVPFPFGVAFGNEVHATEEIQIPRATASKQGPAARGGFAHRPREFPDDPPTREDTLRTRPRHPAPLWTLGPYQSVQVNVDQNGNNVIGDAANEPSIAVDPRFPYRMAIGWRQFDTISSNFRQAGRGYSTDSGRSWTFPGVIEPGVFRSDPVLEADADGNFYYYSLTSNGGNYWCHLFKSLDGGVTWQPGVYAYGGDKAWTAIDRTGGIGRGNFYAAWDPYTWVGCCDTRVFNRSTDGGLSVEFPVAVVERPYWGVTEVGPDGTVYVVGVSWDNEPDIIVVRSTTAQNSGVAPSFDPAVTVNLGGVVQVGVSNSPNPVGLLGQVWIASDHSTGPTGGNLYVLASVDPPGADPLDVHFIRSLDGGTTWSPAVRVNDDAPGTNAWQWFGTMAVAPNGRIDVIWNDTRSVPGGYDSRLYYSFSQDAGVTWSPNVPVSPTFNPHLGWPNQSKLGDYYDMVSDAIGAHVAYAATFNGEQDVYYLRIGDYDCNSNGIGDMTDVAGGFSLDINANGVPDECESIDAPAVSFIGAAMMTAALLGAGWSILAARRDYRKV